jgi:hypothetical protein
MSSDRLLQRSVYKSWVLLEHCTSGVKYLNKFFARVLFGVPVVGACYRTAVNMYNTACWVGLMN